MTAPLEHLNICLHGTAMRGLWNELQESAPQERKVRMKDGGYLSLNYEMVGTQNYTVLGNAVGDVGCSYGPFASVLIWGLDSVKSAETALLEMSDWPIKGQTPVLVLTDPDVFNKPHFQSLIQKCRQSMPFGLVVEDPHKVKLGGIEGILGDWLDEWLKQIQPTDQHPPYLAIRHRLSDEASGRLDGGKIAKLFGLSMAEMGTICGVTKQNIHANPTSKGIQEKLEPLVKAARGVLWCGGDESKFKTWLNQPNADFPEHEGRQLSPLDLIRMGHAQVIADKIQNLLTGHPA